MNLQDFDVEPAPVSDTEFTRIVLHEFGHALGLEHEHQSPEANCRAEIEDEAAVAYYKRFGWTAEQTRFNLNTLVSSHRLRTTPYDRQSIMHYALPQEIFVRGRNSKCFTKPNDVLSPGDKSVVAIMYPDDPARQQQRKAELLSRLDGLMTDAGVSESERQSTMRRITVTYGDCSPIIGTVSGTLTLNCNR